MSSLNYLMNFIYVDLKSEPYCLLKRTNKYNKFIHLSKYNNITYSYIHNLNLLQLKS